MIQLLKTIHELKELNPGYVSVTYGAGGGTRDITIEISRRIKHEIGLECMSHLTCVGHSKNELRSILDKIRDLGIENVIALRGDPPKGEVNFKPHPDGFRRASELVKLVHDSYDFCIAVAGYPEGHIESPDKETDWTYLQKKVSVGADLIVTQLFFDNKDFFVFEKSMRKKGISLPIIPGIMPITNYKQLLKFTQMCGTKIPAQVAQDLEIIKDDTEAVQSYGIEYATRQCEELIAHSVPAIHFYTLNTSKSTKTIIENLRRKIDFARI